MKKRVQEIPDIRALSKACSLLKFLKTKFVLLIIVSVWVPLVAISEEYKFTNKSDQKQFSAKIKSIAEGKVNVEKDGKEFALTISNLIDEDVTYLKKWFAANPSYALRVTVAQQEGVSPNDPLESTGNRQQKRKQKKEREAILKESQSSKSGGYLGHVTSVDSGHFEVAITNDSSVTLEGAEIRYKVFVQSTHSGAVLTNQTGKVLVPKVAIGDTIRVPTQSILLPNRSISYKTYAVDADGEPVYDDANAKSRVSRGSSDMKGIWLRVYKDGKILKEVKKLDGSLRNEESVVWE